MESCKIIPVVEVVKSQRQFTVMPVPVSRSSGTLCARMTRTTQEMVSFLKALALWGHSMYSKPSYGSTVLWVMVFVMALLALGIRIGSMLQVWTCRCGENHGCVACQFPKDFGTCADWTTLTLVVTICLGLVLNLHGLRVLTTPVSKMVSNSWQLYSLYKSLNPKYLESKSL